MHLLLVANLVTTSKALVTRSDALVTTNVKVIQSNFGKSELVPWGLCHNHRTLRPRKHLKIASGCHMETPRRTWRRRAVTALRGTRCRANMSQSFLGSFMCIYNIYIYATCKESGKANEASSVATEAPFCI